MTPSEQNDNEAGGKGCYVRVGPGLFVSPPFIECPKCHEDAFGVNSIFAHHYTRRCKKCLYPAPSEPRAMFSLPKLDKELIYLDQFLLSNMVFALDPSRESKGRNPHRDFYQEAFDRLDILGKKQLIACPSSQFHERESLPSAMFAELRRVYALLRYGLHWNHPDSLHRAQVIRAFIDWHEGLPPQKSRLSKDDAISGDRTAWNGKFSVSCKGLWSSEYVAELRRFRDETVSELAAIFERWRKETTKTFDVWVREEIRGLANSYVRAYKDYVFASAAAENRIAEGSQAHGDSTFQELLPPPKARVLIEIRHRLITKGVSEEESLKKTQDFLLSEHFARIPFVQIASRMWATVAERAAHVGQKKAPNRGFHSDVEFIGSYLPYCDAMFLDNEAAGILRDKNMLSILDEHGARIYSLKNKDDFLAYLDEIENNASPEHMDKVHEVYGEEYLKPYSDVLKHMRDAGPSNHD